MTLSVNDHAVRILLSLYVVEAAAGLVLIGVYKAPTDGWALFSTKAGAAIIAGGISLIAAIWLVVRQTQSSGSLRGKAFTLGLTTNLLTGLILFLLAETGLHLIARKIDGDLKIGPVMILPTWTEMKTQSRKVLTGTNTRGWGSYFVYDQELGWTVGSNRKSSDGLYFSSVEGIRSAGPNIRLANQTHSFRVALIGDSNAFSLEVPFEKSWGYHLQRFLGSHVQVLNFGVNGYGVDQIYLRYQRDVRPWKAQVVVIGFITHDLVRSMAVYPPVSFGWRGFLVKPRFTVKNGKLELVNVPLPTTHEVLNVEKISQLPFIDYDLGYGTIHWNWRFEHAPLFLRFLTSLSPPWSFVDHRKLEETTQELNSRIFTKLIKSIEQAGSIPLVVLLATPPKQRQALVRETLGQAHVKFMRITDCLSEVPIDQRRVPSGHHYSGPANLAIARCTAPTVQRALMKSRKSAQSSDPHLLPDSSGNSFD